MNIQRYQELRQAVINAGFKHDIDWAETVESPADAERFAIEAILVICNSGMKWTVAQGIFERVRSAIENGMSANAAFGHKGKCSAIDSIWRDREELFAGYQASNNKIAYCEALPWIGPITKMHLAKNFGVDCAKPDRHLVRIAEAAGTDTHELCARLSEASGDRIATVDLVIWRAAERGWI